MARDVDREAHELRRLFTLSLDLLCIANFDGYFLRVNPAFVRLLGHAEGDLLGRPFVDFVHPDDRDATLAEVGKLSAGVPTIAFDNRYRCADGSYRWLAWRAQPATDENIIYAVARDETDARAALAAMADREARLRALYESSVDAFVTIDERGVVESCNRACEAMFGVAREALVGRDVSALMPEPFRSRHAGYVARYVATGEARLVGRGPVEVMGRRADGQTFPAEVTVAEIPLSDRRIFLGIVRDVSARKQAEGERGASLAREARERGRLEAAVGILHDVGNVLTGVAVTTADLRAAAARAEAAGELARTARFVRANQTSLAGALGDAKAEALAGVLEGVDRAAAAGRASLAAGLEKLHTYVGHAQDLLAFHRAQSGAGSAPREKTASVAALLGDLRAMTADAVAAAGGTLEVQAVGDVLDEQVDAVRLLRALINAVHNAVEAHAGGGAPLAVTVRAARDGAGALWLTVADNGPGFEGPGEALFADGVTTRARGSGLGLGAARRAVEGAGGVARLTSDGAGRGAAFTVTVPARGGRP